MYVDDEECVKKRYVFITWWCMDGIEALGKKITVHTHRCINFKILMRTYRIARHWWLMSMAFMYDQIIVLQDVGRCDFGPIDSDGAFFNAAHIVLWIIGAKFLLKDLSNALAPPPTFCPSIKGVYIGLDMPHAIANLVLDDGGRGSLVALSSSSIILMIIRSGGVGGGGGGFLLLVAAFVFIGVIRGGCAGRWRWI